MLPRILFAGAIFCAVTLILDACCTANDVPGTGNLQATASQNFVLGSDAFKRLPAYVPDLFGAQDVLRGGPVMFNLRDAAGAEFNLVDSSVAPAIEEGSPWILYKGLGSDKWFFAPRWGRLAKRPDGSPNFTLSVKRQTLPSGEQKYVGGTLSFFFELAQELPSSQELDEWHDRIKQLYSIVPSTGRFNFQPMNLTKGKLNVYGLDGKILPGQVTKDIDIGASSTIAFAYELTGDAAEAYYKQIKLGTAVPPQVALVADFKYRYKYPTCSIWVHGNKRKTYDYFSVNVKARASYWGLVNGAADYSSTRADLRSTGAIQVDVLGSPTGVDKDKLIQALTDRFILQEVGQWIVPDPTPVSAPEPGGFFGGVSVAMKSVNLSASEEWDIRMNFADIMEDIHKLSFNFESAFTTLDFNKNVVLIDDDRKLDLKVVIGPCNYIDRVATVASYVKDGQPIQVRIPDVDGIGGITTGVIQWAAGIEPKPTSAQFELAAVYKSPFTSYTYKETRSISDQGALLTFLPNNYINRSELVFVMPYTDRASVAVCQWKWTPPPASTSAPVSRIIRIGVDQTVDFNPASVPIEFPLSPGDYTGGKLEVALRGIRGDWAGKQSQFELSVGADAKIVEWDRSPQSLARTGRLQSSLDAD
mgnify:FL=1